MSHDRAAQGVMASLALAGMLVLTGLTTGAALAGRSVPTPTATPMTSPKPTPTPTPKGKAKPTPTPAPTPRPTPAPTPPPTPAPTAPPTAAPTPSLSTPIPTETPGATPGDPPTPGPTATGDGPTPADPSPTVDPTAPPSEIPTVVPTEGPSVPPDASAAPGPATATISFGLSSHPNWFATARWTEDLDRAAAAGLRYLRFDVGWRWLEPKDDAWDATVVAKVQAIVDAARSRGLETSITLIETPGWASGERSVWAPPTDMSEYAEAFAYLATSLVGRGSMVYEVWNEPNDPHFWYPSPDASRYATMVRAAYPAIKAADPTATVLAGSVLFNDQQFVRDMYASGAQGYFDAFAIHPYSLAHGPNDRTQPYYCFRCAIEDTRRTMLAMGDVKPIWITEMGWSLTATSEVTRAEYLADVVPALRDYPYVRGFAAYTDDYTNDASWSMVGADGIPFASWYAYTAAAR